MKGLTSNMVLTIVRADGTIEQEPTQTREPVVEVHSAEGLQSAGQRYAPVGRCIYCGSTESLGREHIIPFALNGDAVLPEASCSRCAAITGKFEQNVLRGPMWAVRSLRRLRSRTQHSEAPATERVEIVRDGVKSTVDLPIERCPLILHFPRFTEPGAITGKAGMGINIVGVDQILFGPRPDVVLKELGAQSISFGSGNYQYVPFAKMLAKVAYAMAVANGDASLLDGEPVMLPALLGQREDIGQWVGTAVATNRTYPGMLHRISLERNVERGLLLAEVQLFADSATPSYTVVIGRLGSR